MLCDDKYDFSTLSTQFMHHDSAFFCIHFSTHTWVIVLKIEITGMLTFALLHDSKWAINTGQCYVLIQLLVYQAYIA